MSFLIGYKSVYYNSARLFVRKLYLFQYPDGYFFHPSSRPSEIFLYLLPSISWDILLPHFQSMVIFFYIDVASSDKTLCSTRMRLLCTTFIKTAA